MFPCNEAKTYKAFVQIYYESWKEEKSGESTDSLYLILTYMFLDSLDLRWGRPLFWDFTVGFKATYSLDYNDKLSISNYF